MHRLSILSRRHIINIRAKAASTKPGRPSQIDQLRPDVALHTGAPGAPQSHEFVSIEGVAAFVIVAFPD
jgi:hypothetical protein